MTEQPEDRPRLDPEDRAFVDGVRRHYEAPPMSGARQQAFDTALVARSTRRPWWRPVPWVWATGLAGALVAYLVVSAAPPTHPVPEPIGVEPKLAAGASPLSTEERPDREERPSAEEPWRVEEALGAEELLALQEPLRPEEPLTPEEVIIALSSSDLPEPDDDIPDDYQAIGALFLEGV